MSFADLAMSLESPNDAVNQRFTELQEELRDAVINGVSNFGSPIWARPGDAEEDDGEVVVSKGLAETSLLCSCNVDIPGMRLVRYLQNWVTECAPLLDKFDAARHFQIEVPLLAQSCPSLLHAIMAFSSKHMERRGLLEESNDSLELYQESIKLLGPSLRAKEPTVLVTACVLAVFELMSGSSKDWRRHLEGCAGLFQCFGVNGFSGGLFQAVFWCFARMDLCGGIMGGGAESMTLPLTAWHAAAPASSSQGPEAVAKFVQSLFYVYGRGDADAHANWSVYLCAKVCDLRHRQTQVLEMGKGDVSDGRPFGEQWEQLWEELGSWRESRPAELKPVVDEGGGEWQLFPRILFGHWAAISSNQLYHTACILMLEMRPSAQKLAAREGRAIWHARRVCGISATNPHRGNLVNAIQPLYVAGRLFTHSSERRETTRLLQRIDFCTGWGALWRLRDLEAEWGDEYR